MGAQDELDRAQLWQQQQRRRHADRLARERLMAGDATARAELEARWAALRDRDMPLPDAPPAGDPQ